MIVQPLIIYVIMEIKKRYQLVAWTRNVGKEEVEVRMIPQLHHQTQEHLFNGIAECNRKGRSALARRILLLEQSADFNLMTGHYGEGLRFLRTTALACLEPTRKRATPNKEEFRRLYNKFHEMVRKYSREDILMEMESRLLEERHLEQAK